MVYRVKVGTRVALLGRNSDAAYGISTQRKVQRATAQFTTERQRVLRAGGGVLEKLPQAQFSEI